MKGKYIFYFLSFFNIWIFQKFAQAENKPKYTWIPDEFLNYDFTHFESQLEILKTGNEFLKLHVGTLQFQLEKQKELWQSLDIKLDQITVNLQKLENKILMDSKEHLSEISDMITRQNQLLHSNAYQTSAVDDKWQMMADIKEILKTHDVVLDNFGGKLKNVENILLKASWETHTRELGNNISKNLTVLQNIDKKLTEIETVTAAKSNQMAFNRNLQNYLNKNESPKICHKGEDQKLVCTTDPYPSNCANFNDKYCSNNKCRIHNHHYGPDPFLVACDEHTEGGGWTIIQRRINGSVDFYRNWSEYKNGFGHIDGEFFIGLDKLNALTTALQPVELLIQLQDFNDTMKYAKYDEFVVGNETELYKLKKVGKYSGNAGDSFSQHEGNNFTTKDRNNAEDKNGNCAEYKKGAWWYNNCAWSNLNGMYYNNTKATPSGSGICWSRFRGYDYSLKFVQMSIRPRRI